MKGHYVLRDMCMIGARHEAEMLLSQGAFTAPRDLFAENDPFRDTSARDDAIVW